MALNIGDIVLSEDVFQYDCGLNDNGVFTIWKVDVGEGEEVLYFPAEPSLLAEAFEVECEFLPIDDRAIRVVGGRITTADEFAIGEDFRRWIATYGVDCVEMEGGAVAQVCYRLEVPFIIVRTISNAVNTEDSEEVFEQYATQVSRNLVIYIEELIKAL